MQEMNGRFWYDRNSKYGKCVNGYPKALKQWALPLISNENNAHVDT